MKVIWHRYHDILSPARPRPDNDDDDFGGGGGVAVNDASAAALRTVVLDGLGERAVYDGPLMSMGHGLMAANHRSLLEHNCSLWWLLTDFDLTGKRVQAAAAVPGVEVFAPVSRYRAVVGIAPTFEAPPVKDAVDFALTGGAPRSRLTAIAVAAAARWPRWAVLAGPAAVPGGPASYELVGARSAEELAGRVAAAGELWEVVAEG